jgi:arsenite methyltransferase
MSEQDEIRKQVSETYARAVRTGSSCCGNKAPKGVAAGLAGYATTDLDALPGDAVVNSFGCGNPVAFSEMKEGDTVLDLGSGAGIDLLLAARKVGPRGRVIGIDMTDDMIERARANVAEAGATNVEVRKGLIEALPVETASVDWVISNCVINLSPEKSKVFAEIARVLKPGGRMVVSDIMVQDLPDWMRQSMALYTSCIAGAISESEYLQGLSKAGLVDAEVTERLVYEADQLAALAESDQIGVSCCCGSGIDAMVSRVAEQVAGRVWSAKVRARRPE